MDAAGTACVAGGGGTTSIFNHDTTLTFQYGSVHFSSEAGCTWAESSNDLVHELLKDTTMAAFNDRSYAGTCPRTTSGSCFNENDCGDNICDPTQCYLASSDLEPYFVVEVTFTHLLQPNPFTVADIQSAFDDSNVQVSVDTIDTSTIEEMTLIFATMTVEEAVLLTNPDHPAFANLRSRLDSSLRLWGGSADVTIISREKPSEEPMTGNENKSNQDPVIAGFPFGWEVIGPMIGCVFMVLGLIGWYGSHYRQEKMSSQVVEGGARNLPVFSSRLAVIKEAFSIGLASGEDDIAILDDGLLSNSNTPASRSRRPNSSSGFEMQKIEIHV